MGIAVDALVVEDLIKRFHDVRAVDGVSFRLPAGHILSLLGPSGCGKTTTLRCIAGLERPSSGRIMIAGKPVCDPYTFVPPEKRDLGMVFQSYALWPHLTVFDNVAYGLRVRRRPKDEIADRVAKVLNLFGLSGLERRYASQLSGGQQQRVALARSLVFEPKILLFDEPLSNLDAKLRERMRYEIRELLNRVGITAVYVTHDQSEAMIVADTIILMNQGKIVQQGSPHDLYDHPVSRFVADFLGRANFLEARVLGSLLSNGRQQLAVSEQVRIEANLPTIPPDGERLLLAIRPERVRVSNELPQGPNVWPAQILRQVYLGQEYEIWAEVDHIPWRVVSPSQIDCNLPVYLCVAPADVIYVPHTE